MSSGHSKSNPRPEPLLSIGELARRTNVSPRTIRYYEELGILPTPPRSPAGTRRYPADHQFYVEGALLLKDSGFSLEELKLVGRLALGEPMSAEGHARAVEIVGERMASLKHKIRVLTRIHDVLAAHRGRAASSPLAEILRPPGSP